MLINSKIVPDKSEIKTNVCIIGAGAAGITIARELKNENFSVILLESGGFDYDNETQSLYAGEGAGIIDDQYLLSSRCRYFGGSTNLWAGNCRPLDVIDFEKRSWMPYSGWPFPKSKLDSYYKEAASICEISPFDYNLDKLMSSSNTPHLIDWSNRIVTKLFHKSPPTRFGRIYRNELIDAENVTVYLNANVIEILTNSIGTLVEKVEVACLTGKRFWVEADIFILATGGIENARLLLLSNSTHKEGLGNSNNLVGRFFMGHTYRGKNTKVCIWKSPESLALYTKNNIHPVVGCKIRGALCVKNVLQKRENLLNCAIRITPGRGNKNDTTKQGIKDYIQKILSVESLQEEVCSTAINIDHPEYEGTINPHMRFVGKLNIVSEVSPNPDSRITLIDQIDNFGKKRVKVDWQENEQDLVSVNRCLDIISNYFGFGSLGRVKIVAKDIASHVFKFSHHIGSTRINDDPKQGVINRNCQVHGVKNLYIVGSSVFPTSGHANPTLTIVALSLRLSDYIKNQIKH